MHNYSFKRSNYIIQRHLVLPMAALLLFAIFIHISLYFFVVWIKLKVAGGWNIPLSLGGYLSSFLPTC